MICREKMEINYIKMKCTLIDIIMLQLSRAKPGNPASNVYTAATAAVAKLDPHNGTALAVTWFWLRV